MLHKFSAWPHLSNFDQSEHKNWTKSVTMVRNNKSSCFPRGQFEIKNLKTSNLSADNFKKYSTSMGRHLSPRYGQVILVSGYPVLTAVNWSQHWCAICVQYQSSCAPKLARKCGIKHWFPCGTDGRAADGRAGGVRSRDYQIFWDG